MWIDSEIYCTLSLKNTKARKNESLKDATSSNYKQDRLERNKFSAKQFSAAAA